MEFVDYKVCIILLITATVTIWCLIGLLWLTMPRKPPTESRVDRYVRLCQIMTRVDFGDNSYGRLLDEVDHLWESMSGTEQTEASERMDAWKGWMNE